ITDSLGSYRFENLVTGKYKIQVSYIGKKSIQKTISLNENENVVQDFSLEEDDNALDEVVVTGTLKAVRRSESPVPVETYSPVFFKKNPTANIFEALQNVNGVRPQLN